MKCKSFKAHRALCDFPLQWAVNLTSRSMTESLNQWVKLKNRISQIHRWNLSSASDSTQLCDDSSNLFFCLIKIHIHVARYILTVFSFLCELFLYIVQTISTTKRSLFFQTSLLFGMKVFSRQKATRHLLTMLLSKLFNNSSMPSFSDPNFSSKVKTKTSQIPKVSVIYKKDRHFFSTSLKIKVVLFDKIRVY